jgi:hypothetical protein
VPALRRPTLCPKHARGEREDDRPRIAVRPPEGSSACSLCRQEAEAKDALTKLTSGTRTVEHHVQADDPDEDYPVASPRVRARLDALRRHEEEEARRIGPAVAKMDNERPTLIELDYAKLGRERQRAYDRHMRTLNGGRRLRGSSDVTVIVDGDGNDFETAMASARATRDAILEGVNHDD